MKLYAVGTIKRFDDGIGITEAPVMSDWQELYKTPEEVLEAVEGQPGADKVVPVEFSGEYWVVTSEDGFKAYTWDENYADYLMKSAWFKPKAKEKRRIDNPDYVPVGPFTVIGEDRYEPGEIELEYNDFDDAMAKAGCIIEEGGWAYVCDALGEEYDVFFGESKPKKRKDNQNE